MKAGAGSFCLPPWCLGPSSGSGRLEEALVLPVVTDEESLYIWSKLNVLFGGS